MMKKVKSDDGMNYRLEGYDTFSGESYPLEGSYPTVQDAENAALARLRRLERDQPSVTSGGQDGIQDRVFVVYPDGSRHRVRS